MPEAPYSEPALNQIYDLLFCDKPEVLSLDPSEPGPATLLLTVSDRHVDDRIRLFAAGALRSAGLDVPQYLLGIVVELGLEEGLDVFAAYPAGTARYINYSGRVLFWEVPDSSIQPVFDKIFAIGEAIVRQIGPWDAPRKPPPSTGMLRLTFLVSGMRYIGEGPIDKMFNDPMAGPLLSAMTALMQYLVGKSEEE